MAIFNATLLGIYVDGTLVTHSTDASLSIDMETIDVTSKDSSGWRELLGGTRSWSVSGSAYLDWLATYSADDLYDEYVARTSFNLKIGTEVSGDTQFVGSAYLSSLEISGGTEDSPSFTFTFEGTGVLTESAFT